MLLGPCVIFIDLYSFHLLCKVWWPSKAGWLTWTQYLSTWIWNSRIFTIGKDTSPQIKMQTIIRIVFLYYTTLPANSNPDADLMEELIRNKMSLLRKGLHLLTGNRRTEQSVDFRSPHEKAKKHWTASYFVPTQKPQVNIQGFPFEKVGFNPLSWRLFMVFWSCLWC